MKYEIMIRSIPVVDIPETHSRLITVMNGIPKPWGFGGNGGPPAPDCGSWLLAKANLFKYLGDGFRGSSIVYNYRSGLGDAGIDDDFMVLEFNPMKQDFARMLETVLPRYISAFRAYLAYIGDTEWGLADWEEERKMVPNCRYGVYRIYPVHYFGEQLCRRAFQRTPEEMIRLLSKECERVELLDGGVILVATSNVISLAEANQINARLWKVLKHD